MYSARWKHQTVVIKVQRRQDSEYESSVLDLMRDPMCHTVKQLSQYRHDTEEADEMALVLEYVPHPWGHRFEAVQEAVKRAAQLTRVQSGCEAVGHARDAAHRAVSCFMCVTVHQQGVFEWHQRGYLHRDIKPDNVRVSATGDVVIIDANIAKRISKCARGKVMWKHRAAGTPGFMDPLVKHGVYDWSPAAEVWSVGFMLEDVRRCTVSGVVVWCKLWWYSCRADANGSWRAT